MKSNEVKAETSNAYKNTLSIKFFRIFSTVTFVVGILGVITGIFMLLSGYKIEWPVIIIIGVGLLIFATMLSLISNLAEDVHFLVQNNERQAQLVHYILQHLQRIDNDHEAIKNGIAAISGQISSQDSRGNQN